MLGLAGLLGLLSVVSGILLAGLPRAGALAVTWVIGVYAILYGAALLYYAYQLQALGRAVGATREAVQRAQTRQA